MCVIGVNNRHTNKKLTINATNYCTKRTVYTYFINQLNINNGQPQFTLSAANSSRETFWTNHQLEFLKTADFLMPVLADFRTTRLALLSFLGIDLPHLCGAKFVASLSVLGNFPKRPLQLPHPLASTLPSCAKYSLSESSSHGQLHPQSPFSARPRDTSHISPVIFTYSITKIIAWMFEYASKLYTYHGWWFSITMKRCPCRTALDVCGILWQRAWQPMRKKLGWKHTWPNITTNSHGCLRSDPQMYLRMAAASLYL